MRASVLIFCCFLGWQALFAQSIPKLLLTPQRLRRLKRDRERQTPRWSNFGKRVQTIPDSPERGFELALYYAVTGDDKAGKEAVEWAQAHPCEARQVALISDWVSPVPVGADCHAADDLRLRRDALFLQVAAGSDADALIDRTGKEVLSKLQAGAWENAAELYSAIEYLYTVRSSSHIDLRQEAPQFFSELPASFLLSLRPEQVEHPDWRAHVAALALVGLDPNLEGSQFLQGWALEDRHMIREGEGVGYEFLWADPYLPGVGYENLEPWSYGAAGHLFARADWNDGSCWIRVSPGSVDSENCVRGWQQKTMQFGNLTLIPTNGDCVPIPMRKNTDAVIVSRFQPGQTVYFIMDNTPGSHTADASGLLKVPSNAEGRVCTSLDTLKVPQAQKSKTSHE